MNKISHVRFLLEDHHEDVLLDTCQDLPKDFPAYDEYGYLESHHRYWLDDLYDEWVQSRRRGWELIPVESPCPEPHELTPTKHR